MNFSPVSLVGETVIVQVGHRPYDEATLRNLRAEFSATHVFKREWEQDTIVDIPVLAGAEPLGEKTTEIDIRRTFRYWGPLLNAALVRAFDGKREIARDYPVEVLGNLQRNYVHHPELPEWVQKRQLLQFTPRTLFGPKGKPYFGLLLDAKLRNLLLASCADLLNSGISPIGRYVLVDHPHWDTRVLPRAQLVGRVRSIKEDTLILDDHREGYETIAAADARLSASLINFEWCISQLIPTQAKNILSAAFAESSNLYSGPGRFSIIEDTLEFLRTQTLEAVPGIKFEFGALLSNQSKFFPITELIKKPALVFDPAGTRNDTWNERGIKENGPYDQRTFTPKKLNIAVICQARHEGQVEAFVAKFLDGMPDTKIGKKSFERAPYGDGFLRRFKLERANVQTFTSSSSSLGGYQVACETALQYAADADLHWDLALVQIEEEFKQLPARENPYFGTKAILLKNHVAVQNIRLETMQEPAKSRVRLGNPLYTLVGLMFTQCFRHNAMAGVHRSC